MENKEYTKQDNAGQMAETANTVPAHDNDDARKDLFKRRSKAQCLGAAWKLMIDNPGKILHRTWLPVLVVSILSALSQVFLRCMADSIMAVSIGSLTSVLALVSVVWLLAQTFTLLNARTLKQSVSLMLKPLLLLVGLFLLVSLTTGAVYGGFVCLTTMAQLPVLPVGIVTLIILLCVVIFYALVEQSIYYAGVERLLQVEGEKPITLKKSMKDGWKNKFWLLCMALLMALPIAIVFLVLGIPYMISEAMLIADSMGMLMGDPSGLPSSWPYILGVICFITSVIVMYAMVWCVFCYYYAFGSIKHAAVEAAA